MGSFCASQPHRRDCDALWDDIVAPYPFLSLPKLLGVSGGVLLTLGTSKLIYLKTKANVTIRVAGSSWQ